MVVKKATDDKYFSRTKLMQMIGGGYEFSYAKMEE
jgi:hypothetical protein